MPELGPHNVRELFDYDAKIGRLRWRSIPPRVPHGDLKIGKLVGYKDKKGYRRLRVFGDRFLEHRVVWLWHYLDWPRGTIDHKDHNPSNNKIENLRDVSHLENNRSRRNIKPITQYTDGTRWQLRWSFPTKEHAENALALIQNYERKVINAR